MNGRLKNVLRLIVPTLLVAGQAAAQPSYDLKSPDGRIEIRIRTAHDDT
jgi:hypothetical protein